VSEQDLIKKAAEIMGKCAFSYYCEYNRNGVTGIEVQICPTKEVFEWNPLKDANHLNMVRDKLVELGFLFNDCIGKDMVVIEINDIKGYELCNSFNDEKDAHKSINLTTLTAYVEAFEKWSAQ